MYSKIEVKCGYSGLGRPQVDCIAVEMSFWFSDLTYRGLNKTTDILKTVSENAFPFMKSLNRTEHKGGTQSQRDRLCPYYRSRLCPNQSGPIRPSRRVIIIKKASNLRLDDLFMARDYPK